jgi:hypothetical protein
MISPHDSFRSNRNSLSRLEALRGLTIWGVAYRYPGLEDEQKVPPGIEDLEQVTKMLAEFAAEAARLIG